MRRLEKQLREQIVRLQNLLAVTEAERDRWRDAWEYERKTSDARLGQLAHDLRRSREQLEWIARDK